MIIKLGGSLWLFDPSEAPEGSLIRAENVVMDREGIIEPRKGSSVGSQTSDNPFLYMLDSEGNRYSWVDALCYKNEVSFGDVLTAARPEAVKYKSWNSSSKSIFFANGTDRKRIVDTDMYEWGNDGPSSAPTITMSPTPATIATGTHDGGDNSNNLVDADGDFINSGVYIGDAVVNDTKSAVATITGVQEDTIIGELSDEALWDDLDDYYITRQLEVGTFKVVYTFVRKEGSTVVYESNPSPEASIYMFALFGNTKGGYIALARSYLEVPADSSVTHIRIYRTATDGELFYLETELTVAEAAVAGNEILLDTDLQLSSNEALHDEDHDRPPLGTTLAGPYYDGYLFIGIDNQLYWSKSKQPEYWPSTQYIEVSEPHDPIKRIISYRGTVIVLTRERMKQIQGSGWSGSSFYALEVDAYGGTYSQNGVCVVPSVGVFRVLKDGIYLYNGVDQKYTELLDPIFEQKSVAGLPNLDLDNLSTCWLIHFDQNLFFGYPSEDSGGYPDTVVRVNMANKKISKFDYGREFTFVMEDKTNHKLYAGSDDGYVWQLEVGANDNGAAFIIDVESKQLSLPTRNQFLKWAKHDTYSSASTLYGRIYIDGTLVEIHNLTNVDRDTKRRLITNWSGDRVSLRYLGYSPNIIIYGTQELE